MITSSSSNKKNKIFTDTEQALSDVSQLLSRLCKSRKAAVKLPAIISLTGEVARLTRALQKQGTEHGEGQDNDGYGDPSYYEKISIPSKATNLVR